MGAGHAKAAYALWRGLPDRALRVLVYMALTAKDDDDPALFWQGREALALALGRDLPEEPAADDRSSEAERARRARRAAFEAVRAATSDLVSAGAVVVDQRARPGRNARYALNLKLRTRQATPALSGTGSACLSTQGPPVDRHRPVLQSVQGDPVPEEQQDRVGLISGPSNQMGAPTSPLPHARPKGPHEFQLDDNGRDCQHCPLPVTHDVHRGWLSA